MGQIVAQTIATATQTLTSTTLSFSQQLERWHDFYVLVGTASATLVGLLFLAVTLNAETIADANQAPLRAFASNTFISFLLVLLYALFLLNPEMTDRALGGNIIWISVIGIMQVAREALRALLKTRHLNSLLLLLRRVIFPIAAYVGLIFIGTSLMQQDDTVLYTLSIILTILLGSATSYAWDLLIGIGKDKLNSRVAGLLVTSHGGGGQEIADSGPLPPAAVEQLGEKKLEPPIKEATS